MQKKWSVVLGAIGGAALFVVGVVLLERLFTSSSRDWGAPLQAMLGFVIAVATVVYATLTYRLVDVARTGPRRAAERQAAAAVAAAIGASGFQVSVIADRFPVEMGGEVPTDPLFTDKDIANVRMLTDQLEARALELPSGMVKQAFIGVHRLLMLQTGLLCLVTACLIERKNSETTGMPATWNGVKAHYYTELRDEVFSVEWDVLTSGRIVKDADKALDDLHDLLATYMISASDEQGTRKGRGRD